IVEAIGRRHKQVRLEKQLAEANTLLESEAYDGALSILRGLCAEYPDSPEVALLLARAGTEKAERDRRILLHRDLGEIRSLMAGEHTAEAAARLAALAEQFPADASLRDMLLQARDSLRRAEAIANVASQCDALRREAEFERALGTVDAALSTY